MGTALITIKLMPSSPKVSLKEIKEKSKSIIEKNQGKHVRFEEQPIAFGLSAVLVYFDLDESLDLEPIEEALKKIKNVNSVQVIDMRRAFG